MRCRGEGREVERAGRMEGIRLVKEIIKEGRREETRG